MLTLHELRKPPTSVDNRGRRTKHRLTAEQRFWEYVPTRSTEECWEWQGHRDGRGYGRLSVADQPRRAHRISYLLAYGEISPELVVMHRCDNPPCVNPAHLSLGTTQDNTADMVAKGRQRGAPKGLGNGRGKLTDEDVRHIRESWAAGESCVSIARRMDLHDSYVGRVARGVRRTAA